MELDERFILFDYVNCEIVVIYWVEVKAFSVRLLRIVKLYKFLDYQLLLVLRNAS